MSTPTNTDSRTQVLNEEERIGQLLVKFANVKSERGFNKFSKEIVTEIAKEIGIVGEGWEEITSNLFQWLTLQRNASQALLTSAGDQRGNQGNNSDQRDQMINGNPNDQQSMEERIAAVVTEKVLRALSQARQAAQEDDDEDDVQLVDQRRTDQQPVQASNQAPLVANNTPTSRGPVTQPSMSAIVNQVGNLSRTVELLKRESQYAEEFPVVELTDKRSTHEYENLMYALRHMRAARDFPMSPTAMDHITKASDLLVKRALALSLAETDGWGAATKFLENSPTNFKKDYPEFVSQMKEEAKLERKRKTFQKSTYTNTKKAKSSAPEEVVAQEPPKSNRVVGRPNQDESKRGNCYKCHKPGHFAKFCPLKGSDKAN